jgi:hypothetical protein
MLSRIRSLKNGNIKTLWFLIMTLEECWKAKTLESYFDEIQSLLVNINDRL